MVLTNKQSVTAQTDSAGVWKCHKVAACVLSLCLLLSAAASTHSLDSSSEVFRPLELGSEEIQAQRLDRKRS